MIDYPWLLLLAVAMGGIAQRATGMGFALASAPLAIIALGPLEGVLLMNLLGLPAAGLALFLLWRKIEWNVILPMFIPCVLGIWLGVWFLGEIDPAFLEVGIGLALLLAVIITVKSPPLPSTTTLIPTPISTPKRTKSHPTLMSPHPCSSSARLWCCSSSFSPSPLPASPAFAALAPPCAT